MAKQFIDFGDKIISKYLKDVKKHELITNEEEIEIAKRIQNGDESAVDELITSNLRFVISIAKDYQNTGIPMPDLISEGNYGLIIAAKRFDYTKGNRFISYAVHWIRQSIIQFLNENSRTIRLPVNIINKIQAFKRNYTLKEIEAIEDEFSNIPSCVSLNQQLTEEGFELIDIIPDEEAKNPFELLKEEEGIKHDLNRLLNNLSNRERFIIECYFGLNGEPMTLDLIGEEMSLSQERVRQLKDRAIRILRHNIDKFFQPK